LFELLHETTSNDKIKIDLIFMIYDFFKFITENLKSL
jgi:hypothetical protein